MPRTALGRHERQRSRAMGNRGLAALGLGLGLWLGGCETAPEPGDVKKVVDCVKVFKKGIDERDAKTAARSLIEESALTEEAVDATCQCYTQLPPETRHREALVA